MINILKPVFHCVMFALSIYVLFYMEAITEWIITVKQKQRNLVYTRYVHFAENRSVIPILSIIIASIVAYAQPSLFESMIFIIFIHLAIIGIVVDKKIRIIPNEYVVTILCLGTLRQLVLFGIEGVFGGILMMFTVIAIFILNGLITRSIIGKLGIGAGDLKLVMALGMFFGLGGTLHLLYSIIFVLAIYLFIGIATRKLSKHSTFPMCAQIMGGASLALAHPIIVSFFRLLNLF